MSRLRRLEVQHRRVAHEERQLLLAADAKLEPVDQHPRRELTFVAAFVVTIVDAPLGEDGGPGTASFPRSKALSASPSSPYVSPVAVTVSTGRRNAIAQ